MKIIILIISAYFVPFLLIAQENNTSLIEKIKEENNSYKKKIDAQTVKATEYLNLALDNLDGSKLIISNMTEKSTSEKADQDMANVLINNAKTYTAKLDSVYKIISKYKDSVKTNDSKLTKLTGKPYVTYPSDTVTNSNYYNTTVNSGNDSPAKANNEKNEVYTVQIGSDNTRDDLFKNIDKVKVIKCKDGYFRYIVGEFKSYEEALHLQQQFLNEGNKDCFVRTMQSIELLKK